MLNYDKERNEVVITGCGDCPFLDDSYERIFIMGGCERCSLNGDIEVKLSYFPNDCLLRDPNFKLTRNIK